VSDKRSTAPAGPPGLPVEAIMGRSEVPELPRTRGRRPGAAWARLRPQRRATPRPDHRFALSLEPPVNLDVLASCPRAQN